MIDILLVFPNIRTLIPPIYPIELGLLSASLQRRGHRVAIEIVSNHADLLRLPRRLARLQPEMVGFTAVYNQVPHVLRMAAMVKAWRPMPVLVGGKAAMLHPEDLMADPNVDGVCIGEGDEALPELVEARKAGRDHRGIHGFWFRDAQGALIRNPRRPFIQDLDALPFPDYGAVDFQHILEKTGGVLVMVAGRGGCDHQCSFCGVPPQRQSGTGRFVRMRSVERVLEEIAHVQERYRFRHIYFRDDTFTLDRDWAMGFARAYGERFSYSYEILTRADRLDPELVQALAASGCECVWLGADSGNDHIRDEVLRKNVDNERLEAACAMLHDAGIRVLVTNMLGLPFETPAAFEDTVALNQRIYAGRPTVSRYFGSSPAVFVFDPFPGTPLWHTCRDQGWLRTMRAGHWAYAEPHITMPRFPRREIRRQQRRFRYRVYRETNPGWALWCLAIDSTLRRVAPSFGPLFRPIEHRFAHGEWP
jgi:anaerobic magnesium-protoporphyrin IX monomethyl ester cyclase